jgi:NAD(P)-dependent dehydrogenase (short-subunit alcohol dehydrogenase family)
VVELAKDGLDILVLNAGISASDNRDMGDTEDGYDRMMQVNHLAHMALLADVFPALQAAADARGEARVVFQSSMALLGAKDQSIPTACVQKSPREWPADSFDVKPDGVHGRYGLSKACNFVCSWALHEKLKAKGYKVRSLCAHPGFVATQIFLKNETNGNNATMAHQYLGMMGHSDADGSMPLLVGAVGKDAASGDCYGPDGSKDLSEAGDTQLKGPPEKISPTDCIFGGAHGSRCPCF